MTKSQARIDTILLAMKTLLHPADRDEILRRISAVRADSQRRWGKMSAAQMICHLSDSFRSALGEKSVSSNTNLFKRTVMKRLALALPVWPHGVKTRPEMDQEQTGTPPAEFAADVAQLKTLFERYCAAQRFSPHPMMGPMSRAERLRWAYQHMNHHLRQFKV
jgi:hypothetical protein